MPLFARNLGSKGIRLFLGLCLLFSSFCFGGVQDVPEETLAALVKEYKAALNSKDKKKIKSLVTKEYFKKLNKNDLLDRLFQEREKSQKGQKQKKKETAKIQVIKSKVVKGKAMVGSQEQGSEHKIWYEIKMTEQGPKIDQERRLD